MILLVNYSISKRLGKAGLILLVLTLSGNSYAVVVTNLGVYDQGFVDLCVLGTANPAAGNNACEYAVVETKRGQNNGTGGNAQMLIRDAVFSNIKADENIPSAYWGGAQLVNYSWILSGNANGDISYFTDLGGANEYTVSALGNQFDLDKELMPFDRLGAHRPAANCAAAKAPLGDLRPQACNVCCRPRLGKNPPVDILRLSCLTSVVARLRRLQSEVATAAPVIHELRFGIECLPSGKRKACLADYLGQLLRQPLPILVYDRDAALWHADQRAALQANGSTIPYPDGQIAAIAPTNGLILATRNVNDFRQIEGLIIESWLE